MKKSFWKCIIAICCMVVICASEVMVTKAVPPQYKPQIPYLPMWYYAANGEATPEIHSTYFSYTKSMSGVEYIKNHGLTTYTKKENLNLERFLLENPDFVAAGVVTLDDVWNTLVANDSINPRQFHSMDGFEEYYCLIRNQCIQLNIYPCESNKLTVSEKALIINNFICQYAEYSMSNFSFQEMYETHSGIFNAYVGYFDVMASISGINSGVVYGPGHSWNAIQIEDGQWYQIDVTWNDMYNNAYFMLKCLKDGHNNEYKQMTPYAQDWWITEEIY